MTIFEYMNEVIWSPSFWPPQNATWKDFEHEESSDGYRVPQIYNVVTALKLVPLLLLMRFTCERYIFVKFARWAGIEEKQRKKPPAVDILERVYRLNPFRKWTDEELTVFSKRLDWSVEQVQIWFKARKNFEKPTVLQKFCESSWRFLSFACIFTYGVHMNWTEEWFWDFKLSWKNFPQPLSESLHWYFIVSLANYCSWSISHFWDVQRKDSGIKLFHHIVTLILYSIHCYTRFYRIGLLICLLHDIGEVLLELSKCLKYLRLKFTCKLMGILFAIVWIVTRNIIFPFYTIPSIYFHAPQNISQSFPFSCLHGPCHFSSFSITVTHFHVLGLISLALLHVYWTWRILTIIYLALFFEKLGDDTVSDDDDSDDD